EEVARWPRARNCLPTGALPHAISPGYTRFMSRPEGPYAKTGPCHVGLAGGSPATVSASAPCSRLRAWGEIPPSERSVEGPRGTIRSHGGEQNRGPNAKA